MRLFAVICLVSCVFIKSAAAEACRHALVMALDVSGSVDEAEYAQQLLGLANALNAPDVRALIIDGAGAPVSLAVFEWSSRNHQHLIQPWTALRDEAALDAAIIRIRNHRKVRAGLKTAIGTAMSMAGEMLVEKAHCWQRTIDVSGDGRNNIGPSPFQVYAGPRFDGVTVNALVVTNPNIADEAMVTETAKKIALAQYYEAEVIHGPNAFAMIALGYQDYTRAMRRKILRELSMPMLGGLSGEELIPPT